MADLGIAADNENERKDDADGEVAAPAVLADPGPGLIPIYRRGHALPQDLRSRVMLHLKEGLSKQLIANRLSISRSTVLRYEKSARAQSQEVPIARPRGGYRSSVALLNRQQILQLGEMLLRRPKLTIRELKQLAIEADILNPDRVPSDTTIWRAIRKLNLDFSKALYVDPKGSKETRAAERKEDDQKEEEEEKKNDARLQEGDLIAEERSAFRFAQKQGNDGQLNPLNLIFMDETNSRAFDQAHYAWGRKHRRTLLFRPKGMSPTFNVMACIGVEEDTPGKMFLHYIIVPPRRDFRGVPTKWKVYEFRNPTAGIDLGYSVAQIQRDLTFDELKELIKQQQLRVPSGFPSDAALESELRRVLVQVRTQGKVGMLREMPQKQRYLGGSIKAFRSTAADVVDYIENLMIPFYVKRKFHGLANECHEDSDGVIGCPDAGQHFSVPYVPPQHVSRLQLLRAKQKAQRQWQRALHHMQVYGRSKRAQTDAGKAILQRLELDEQKKDQEAKAAQDAWTRHERQLERAGSYIQFQDEIAGVGYKRRLANKYLVWDCASTHGAVKITSARKKSFWHEHAQKAGMKGVIFLPPRTPTLNPIELVFGFVKHHVRKTCPDEGYSAAGLMQAIHNAFRMVTPSMIMNWVKKSGYRFHSPLEEERARRPSPLDGVVPMEMDQEEEEKGEEREMDSKQAAVAPRQDAQNLVAEDAAVECYSNMGTRYSRKRSIICMDEHGTVIRKKTRGSVFFDRILDKKLKETLHWAELIHMENITPAVNAMESIGIAPVKAYSTAVEAFCTVGSTRRWSGLGPEPAGLQDTMPENVLKTQDGTLWEIDGIVDYRVGKNRIAEFLVRYKGWGPEYDEWMSEADLDTARGAIKEYWERSALMP